MRRKIIARDEYEVYFIEAGKRRPGKKEIREALRALHPFYANDSAVTREACVIAGTRFEIVTVFAEPFSLKERIIGQRRRTQTQALVARFAPQSPCTVRASGELLVLKEKPESIRRSGHPDEANDADCTVTEIIDDRNALSEVLARRTPLLAVAAFLPVAFAIACATIGQGRGQNAVPQESDQVTAVSFQPVPAPVHELHDFFSCLKEDIDAVNESGGTILSYQYEGKAQTSVTMKISGGKIVKLGERLKKAESISDISIPDVSFGAGYPVYTVCCARDDVLEKKAAQLDWTKEQNLEAACTKAGIKIEKIKLSPFTECSFIMEMQALTRCISLLEDFCDRESIDIKTCVINAGSTCSVSVTFAEKNGISKTHGPDAESVRRAFRQSEKSAEKKETDIHPIVGKISEGGKKTVTFRKTGTGKISNEGGLE